MSDTEGTTFGRYRLIALLGRGGMGEVWRAFDTVTERIVALKVLPTQFADDAVFQERFRREARSAAALDEPHVVPIHDFGEIDGRLFVTMRLIKGRDLQDLLGAGRIDPARAVGIIDQVASALHAAHQVNLVHRDVKPSNILVAEDDFAYLIDFGIARGVGQSSLTATSSVIGTWAYMAPERITAGQTDSRADIYALACVLYECLTGRQPFGGDSLEQQIGGHLTLPPPRASDHRADVPAELDAVIATGMAKNPDDRYATTREMAHAAKAAVTGPATRPNLVPPTIAAPFRNPYPNPDPQRTPRSGTVANYPMPRPSGPSPSDPTQHRPMPQPPSPAGAKISRRGRLIAFSGAGAAATTLAVVAAIVFSQSSDHGSAPAPSTTAAPSALPNTGPFTGTFTAAMGPMTELNGAPASNSDAGAFSETWRLRSACGANGCVATASTGGRYPVKDLIFDNVGGRWLAVTSLRRTCGNRDDEAWIVISLQPQFDGTMSGEATWTYASNCFGNRTLTMTRTADADISQLPDPTTLPPRVVSLAEALHGSYDDQVTYANGIKPKGFSYDVRTDCVRTGDRCMSYFLNSKDNKVKPFIFANGSWTRTREFDDACSSGGTAHTTHTVTMPLPQPIQNPIPVLSGHGYDEVAPGTKCHSQSLDEMFTRTGD